MRWPCERGCGAGGAKRYASAAEADRYARVLDREDRRDLGRPAPVGVLPLRLVRALRRRRERSDGGSGTAHGSSE
jgi:hypothetical protein